MPARNLRSRAYQLVAEPESAVTITSSGSRDDSSQNSSIGLIGSALIFAWRSTTVHQRATFRSTL